MALLTSTILAIAAIAVGVGTTAYTAVAAGEAADEAAEKQAAGAEAQALDAQNQALEQAKLIRRRAHTLAATQRAALAKAGVDVGSGTAVKIEENTTYESEYEAMKAISAGNVRAKAFLASAGGYRAEGAAALEGGAWKAGGTILEGVSKGADAWHRMQPAAKTTPAGEPKIG